MIYELPNMYNKIKNNLQYVYCSIFLLYIIFISYLAKIKEYKYKNINEAQRTFF